MAVSWGTASQGEIDRVIIKHVADAATQLELLQRGEADIVHTQASASWQGKVPGQVTSEPVEISIAVPIQPAAPRITTLTLCAEVTEDDLCTSPQIEFQPDVTVYYVFTYENLSPSCRPKPA